MLAGENFRLVLAGDHPGAFFVVPLGAGVALNHFFLLLSVWTATATVDGHILNLNWIPLGTSARTWK